MQPRPWAETSSPCFRACAIRSCGQETLAGGMSGKRLVTAAARARSVGMTMRLRYLALLLIAGLIAAPAVDAKPRTRKVAQAARLRVLRRAAALRPPPRRPRGRRRGARAAGRCRCRRRGRRHRPARRGRAGVGRRRLEGGLDLADQRAGGRGRRARHRQGGRDHGVRDRRAQAAGDRRVRRARRGCSARSSSPATATQLLVDGTQGARAVDALLRRAGPIAVDDVASAAIAPPRQWREPDHDHRGRRRRSRQAARSSARSTSRART